MIEVSRDALWWDAVATHPDVAPHVFGGAAPVSLASAVENERSLPLRSAHGGIIFAALDPVGSVFEMHTLYTPEGWGREVANAAPVMMERAFETALAVLTYEQEGHYRSRPPRSHGWRIAGQPHDLGLSRRLIGWLLTRDDWLASPARRRMLKCPS